VTESVPFHGAGGAFGPVFRDSAELVKEDLRIGDFGCGKGYAMKSLAARDSNVLAVGGLGVGSRTVCEVIDFSDPRLFALGTPGSGKSFTVDSNQPFPGISGGWPRLGNAKQITEAVEAIQAEMEERYKVIAAGSESAGGVRAFGPPLDPFVVGGRL
jgi:hypothetical protein